jgi:hypothetical protein
MDRAPDRLPTTTTGEPVATVPSGPLPTAETSADVEEADQNGAHGVRFEVPDPSDDEAEDEDEEDEEEGGEEEESDNGMDVDDTELHPASVRV